MRRWRVVAGGALVAVLLVAGYFLGFRQPRAEKITGLVAEAEQLRSQQTQLRREIKGLEEVAAREGELDAALTVLERLIPSELEQPSVLAQMQTAAEAAGVELVSVTFGDPEVPESPAETPIPGSVLATMPVTVVVDGQFRGITDLLRRVEVDFDRAVLVGTVALTEAEGGFPQLTGTWSGQAYVLLPAGDPLLVDPDAPPADPAPPAEQPKGAA